MWCLFLKFGNSRRVWIVISSSENIGVAGTDSFLCWPSNLRRVGKRSDKGSCTRNPPTGAKSRSSFLASRPLIWVWMLQMDTCTQEEKFLSEDFYACLNEDIRSHQHESPEGECFTPKCDIYVCNYFHAQLLKCECCGSTAYGREV